jgi:hypothetical protein
VIEASQELNRDVGPGVRVNYELHVTDHARKSFEDLPPDVQDAVFRDLDDQLITDKTDPRVRKIERADGPASLALKLSHGVIAVYRELDPSELPQRGPSGGSDIPTLILYAVLPAETDVKA